MPFGPTPHRPQQLVKLIQERTAAGLPNEQKHLAAEMKITQQAVSLLLKSARSKKLI
jgi:predicted DNA-binding protein (UPF0251 family)